MLSSSGKILNINKPLGWTSNDVIRWIKKREKTKVGHAGTLDPFANGVLLVVVGSATKMTNELMRFEKQYRALIEFGIDTDTLDISGKIAERRELFPDERSLKSVINSFIGTIEQEPPSFSALKVNGRRAYELARAGKKVELEKRQVYIHAIELVRFNGRTAELDITCSKGVYIRSLARDIAKECGTVGYLRKLTRTRIGNYKLDDSLTISQLN